jgi:hypothetical protein
MDEYAPQYSKRERISLAIKLIALIFPFFIALKFWLLPWFSEYAKNAHCYNYGSFTGVHVVFYGLFVGVPLFISLLLVAVGGKKIFKIIQLGQYPLPGEKVSTPTKYVYGFRAKINSYIFILCLLIFVGLAVKGYVWATEIINNPKAEHAECKNS